MKGNFVRLVFGLGVVLFLARVVNASQLLPDMDGNWKGRYVDSFFSGCYYDLNIDGGLFRIKYTYYNDMSPAQCVLSNVWNEYATGTITMTQDSLFFNGDYTNPHYVINTFTDSCKSGIDSNRAGAFISQWNYRRDNDTILVNVYRWLGMFKLVRTTTGIVETGKGLQYVEKKIVRDKMYGSTLMIELSAEDRAVSLELFGLTGKRYSAQLISEKMVRFDHVAPGVYQLRIKKNGVLITSRTIVATH